MKVIDLLNKIANGEKLPRKLKGNNHTYTGFEDLNYQICNYKDEDGDVLFSDDYDWCDPILLNEKVEIIEEPKKIEKINISTFPKRNNSLKKTAIKVNEIIDKLNKED